MKKEIKELRRRVEDNMIKPMDQRLTDVGNEVEELKVDREVLFKRVRRLKYERSVEGNVVHHPLIPHRRIANARFIRARVGGGLYGQ